LNFGEIQTALIGGQDYGLFSSATSVNDWLVKRYGDVWAAADWPFKIALPTTLNAVGGTVAATAPADMFKPVMLFDSVDNPLEYLDPRQFYEAWGSLAATSTGSPTHYSFLDGTVLLGPTPSASQVMKLVYERTLSVKAAGGVTWVAGSWDKSTLTQVPAWHDSFHYMLVHGAASIGLGLLGSGDAAWHEEQFTKMLGQLVQLYAPFNRTGTLQFRRDSIG
jgi:hypothetical protein